LWTGFETVLLDGTAWRVFSAYGGERDVHVLVGEKVESRSSILWAVLRGTLLPMAVALPLLAGALWWAIFRSMEPLRAFGRTLAERKPDALHVLAIDQAPSEMQPMVQALNDLFERIATLLESERRFTADASHELRTPISAIRAQAQVALGETDDALRRHALQNTLVGCDRAIHLVEQLLMLSRLEASLAPAMTDIDLAALARQVVGDLAPKAIGKGQILELSAERPCHLQGNATLLTVLLRNLVDNAVRYSPQLARIKVSVSQPYGRAQLEVHDSGPGLSADDCARLGERFFRVPGSLENGSGLGWSIVQRIAAVHRFKLLVEPSPDLGGLVVRVCA
jgi:two-component system sensor histidine kinase QseC